MRRAWALAAALAVPLCAILELSAHGVVAARVPSAEDWQAVASALAASHEPGTLVVVAPRWAEPQARAVIDEEVLPLAHLARADVSRFARATEISLHGQRSPELARFTERSATAIGPFVVRELDNPAPTPVVFDFLEAFGATTRVSATEPPAACRWSTHEPVVSGGLGGHPTFPAERFVCPGSAYTTTALTVIADEKFLPRRCIWAHPFAHGEKVVAFDDVPVGRARKLVGHHGMYWVIERDGLGADVEIEARVGGASIGFARHTDGDGWSSFSFDLPPASPDARATVELRVRTTDDRHRHYCFEATLR